MDLWVNDGPVKGFVSAPSKLDGRMSLWFSGRIEDQVVNVVHLRKIVHDPNHAKFNDVIHETSMFAPKEYTRCRSAWLDGDVLRVKYSSLASAIVGAVYQAFAPPRSNWEARKKFSLRYSETLDVVLPPPTDDGEQAIAVTRNGGNTWAWL